MKTINDIISEGKSGTLKKLNMLTIMVAYQIWKEYKLYDEFFGKLTEEELDYYEELNKEFEQIDEDNAKDQWSFFKQFYGIINKNCDYVLSYPDDEFSKSDKKYGKK